MLTRVLKSIVSVLNPQERNKGIVLLFLSLIASFLDVFGLASLVPIILIIAEPGGIFKTKWTATIYSALGFTSEKSFLLSLLAGFLIFFLLKTIAATAINYIQAKFSSNVGYNLVVKQVNKYANIQLLEFNEIGSAKLVANTLDIPFLYIQNILRPTVVLFTEAIICLIIVVGILVYKPTLLLILGFVLVPICLLTYRFVRKRMADFAERSNNLRINALAKVNDLFTGFVELRLADKQKNFAADLFKIQKEFQELDAKSYLYGQLPTKTIELAAIIGVLIIFLYAVLLGSADASILTLIGLFAAAAYRLIPSLNRILTVFVQYRNYLWLLDELSSYEHLASVIQDDLPPSKLKFDKALFLEQISFKFPDANSPALDRISLTIKKGEKVGFIGTSGSGKTTLMNLLLRFYLEESGNVKVDEVKLGEAELRSWHQLIGYVKQDTFLMRASICDNITLGEKSPDITRLNRAVEQASLQSLIDSLPEGLDTMIGERGSKLSGGQRQRIGIARALYKQAEVLILDEATSALDNETEREVSEAINRLSNTDMTILIVAHRLTTLRKCDRIYELQDGKLVAEHQYVQLAERLH